MLQDGSPPSFVLQVSITCTSGFSTVPYLSSTLDCHAGQRVGTRYEVPVQRAHCRVPALENDGAVLCLLGLCGGLSKYPS